MRFLFLLLINLVGGLSLRAQITGRAYAGGEVALPHSTRGVQGIQVTAFRASGQAIATTHTDAQGEYRLSVPLGGEVRVEFTQLPAGHYPTAGRAVVRFVQSPARVDLSLLVPSLYTGTKPRFAQTVFPVGVEKKGGFKEIVIHSGTPNDSSYFSPVQRETPSIGAVWALAYARPQDRLYSAAFVKRHSPLGELGTGGIYVTDLSTQQTTPFINLDALGIPTSPAAFRKNRTELSHDSLTFSQVGKVGLGGMDASDDGRFLFVMNLYDRQLYQIALPKDGRRPNATDISALKIPLTGCKGGEARPFAVKYFNDKIHVGVTCDAQQSQDPNDLKMILYSAEMSNSQSVVWKELPIKTPPLGAGGLLNYPRGTLDYGRGRWLPWTDNYQQTMVEGTTYWSIYPQPLLSDIEFDTDGSLILALMDRLGHQTGDGQSFWPKGALQLHTYQGLSGGDVLRAALVNDHYELEQNAKAGGRLSKGRGNGEGPAGGEFYFDDQFSASGVTWHKETAMGGLALLPATDELMVSSREPEPDKYATGGIKWFSNQTGVSTRSLSVFPSGKQAGYFWKTNNVGDVELLPEAAPIEIGDRIWVDVNGNGQQEADEPALAAIVLHLYRGEKRIGSTVSDAQGHYLFTNAQLEEHIGPFCEYQIRVDLDQPSYGVLELTSVSQAGNSALDNDAVSTQGQGIIRLKTDAPGVSLHQLDIGFRCHDAFSTCPSNDALGLSLSPNPTIDKVNIVYRSEKQEGMIKVELADLQGHTIETTAGGLEKGMFRTQFYLNKLPNSTYQVIITEGTRRVSKSLLKY